MAIGQPFKPGGNQFVGTSKRTARKPAKAARKPKAAKRRAARKKRT